VRPFTYARAANAADDRRELAGRPDAGRPKDITSGRPASDEDVHRMRKGRFLFSHG